MPLSDAGKVGKEQMTAHCARRHGHHQFLMTPFMIFQHVTPFIHCQIRNSHYDVLLSSGRFATFWLADVSRILAGLPA
jgi:hypothetical protein